MKILNLAAPVAFGGGETLFVLTAKELAKRNIKFVQINFTKSKKFEEVLRNEDIEFITVSDFDIGHSPSKIDYIKVFFRLIPVVSYNRKLKDLMKEAQIIHAHGFPVNFLVFLLKKLGVIDKKCALVYSHHSYKSPLIEPFRLLYERILNEFDLIIGASSKTSSSLLRVFPRLKNKIVTVSNGVDLTKFSAKEHTKNNLRIDFNLPESDILGTYVARFSLSKNHMVLIEVVKNINDRGFKILLLGDGTEKDKFIERAREEGVLDRFILKGFVENSLVPYYLKASDFYIHPAEAEGFGIAILEAMASGLPAVIFKNVYIEEFESSVLVSEDLKEFIEHTKKLIYDEDFRATMSAKAKRTAEKLSISRMVDKYIEYLQMVLERKNNSKVQK